VDLFPTISLWVIRITKPYKKTTQKHLPYDDYTGTLLSCYDKDEIIVVKENNYCQILTTRTGNKFAFSQLINFVFA